MAFDRAGTLHWLRTTPEVPVLIIGGGINGAGVLRELAINGIDALLVEKADFASGATGASSRMIHGGLRYLEHGEFRLVREALRERNRLLRNAPHAVFPLPTVIPLFSRWAGFGGAVRKFLGFGGRPGRRGSWLVRIGLGMYARYAGNDDPLPRRSFASRRRARKIRPGFDPRIIGTATYFDAWNPAPERLCLEVLGDARRAHVPGVRAVNYLAVAGFAGQTVELRDEISGEILTVRPRVVVNSTGAWVDRTNRELGVPSEFIGGTKGSHMIVDHPELYALTQGAEIFYENRDGRICLILPLHGRVLVGATDLRIDDPDTARCEADELIYLATAVREVFPGIVIEPAHVLGRMCGVRPLPRSPTLVPGAISRDHACRESPPDTQRTFPILSLIGGKWTTFRALAELAADDVFRKIGHLRRAHSPHLAIGGGRDHPGKGQARERWIAGVAQTTGIARPAIGAWFDRHGTTAAAIAAHAAQASGRPVDAIVHGWHEIELDYICRHEAVQHLDDLLVRRTTLGLFAGLDATAFARCGTIAAQALGWSPRRLEEELDRTERILRERHGVNVGR